MPRSIEGLGFVYDLPVKMMKNLCSIRFLAARAFSSGGVRVTEQKAKVGGVEINYVASSIEGGKPTKTLVCLPGALGNK